MNGEKVRVRFGIIGAGMITAFHAEAIKALENAELTAVYDCDLTRVREFAAQRGIEAYSDFDEFLAGAH